MKKVIKNNYDLLKDAVDMICNPVSSTLGPCGNNGLISNNDVSSFITNDGVTIANNIESDDTVINTLLEIIKESSLKTNEEVGDGTSTTLILLQSIINDGIKEITNGYNATILKNELDITLTKVIKLLNKYKMKSTDKDLLNILITSSNDYKIGTFIYKVYKEIKNADSIKIIESYNGKTYYEIKKGYTVDTNVSNLYLKTQDKIELNNVYLLLLRGYLDDLEQISDIINECLTRKKQLIILIDDFNENITQKLLIYNIDNNANIYIFKTPEYASRKNDIEEDITIMTNSIIKNINYESVIFKDLGFINNLIIEKDKITIINTNNNNIKDRINYLKKQLKSDISIYDKDFIVDRISMLNNGYAYIYVGGNTKTEIKEKLMRYEDAINALKEAKKGILYGEGISYLIVSNYLSNDIISERIIKNALLKPFITIFNNASVDYKKIMNKIIESNYKLIYNFNKNKLDNIKETNIIDPFSVEVYALKNAISIASMLLTTKYIIINE